MKVQITGNNLDIEDVWYKLNEVIDHTISKAQAENKGLFIEGTELVDAEFTVKFKVEGIDEPQVMTVEHHKGTPEIFQWVIDMDNDTEASNKEESMFDAWTASKVQGKDLTFEEINSIYDIMDIDEIPELTEEYSDMSKKVYQHKDGFRVVQVRQKRRLIQEYKLIPKEDTESK